MTNDVSTPSVAPLRPSRAWTAMSSVGSAVDVAVERSTLALQLPHPDRDTPALVAALVAAGAQILEVRAEMPALEDVYVHLMGADGGDG